MKDAGPAFDQGLYYNELYFEVKETSSIVRSTYFAIDGTRIAQPTKQGIYIRKDEMSDGSVKTYKFILNK